MADNYTGQHGVKNSYIQMLSSLKSKSLADKELLYVGMSPFMAEKKKPDVTTFSQISPQITLEVMVGCGLRLNCRDVAPSSPVCWGLGLHGSNFFLHVPQMIDFIWI